MSQQDKVKWNQRYASGDYRKTNPVDLLHEWAPRLRPGKALDIACGAGRNALYLAELGFDVDAIDISSEGLRLAQQEAAARKHNISWIEQDFDEIPVVEGSFDLIIVFWFVNLPLISRLCQKVRPGGYLISMQHLAAEDGGLAGPRSERFRVQPGELKKAVSELQIEYYHEGTQADADGSTLAAASVVAKNTRAAPRDNSLSGDQFT